MVEGPLNIVTREEVEGALRGMKNGKAAGQSGMVSSDAKKLFFFAPCFFFVKRKRLNFFLIDMFI